VKACARELASKGGAVWEFWESNASPFVKFFTSSAFRVADHSHIARKSSIHAPSRATPISPALDFIAMENLKICASRKEIEAPQLFVRMAAARDRPKPWAFRPNQSRMIEIPHQFMPHFTCFTAWVEAK
jgi:hypothetical protein